MYHQRVSFDFFFFSRRSRLAEELNEIVSEEFDLRLEPKSLDDSTALEANLARSAPEKTNAATSTSKNNKKSSDASGKKRAPRKAAKPSGEGRQKRERDVVQVAEEIKHFSRIANGVCGFPLLARFLSLNHSLESDHLSAAEEDSQGEQLSALFTVCSECCRWYDH